MISRGKNPQIIECLNTMFPRISVLSINVQEFEKATYCNKALVHPWNTTRDRHFEPGQRAEQAGSAPACPSIP